MSLSACANLQRTWGPRGSLTIVLCEFLSKPVFRSNFAIIVLRREKELRLTEIIDRRKAADVIIRNSNVPCQVRHSPASYDRLRLSDWIYTFFSFQLHASCQALHHYTLQEKKKAARGEGPGFDDDFQALQLSSLAKLVSILLFGYCCLSQASDDSECCGQNMNDTIAGF